ncbi:MAG TPA: hypothetical protein VKX16_19950 [Chloroflexota bacterium]|nr:hypothetical protein [Chloroflexota bacterium]
MPVSLPIWRPLAAAFLGAVLLGSAASAGAPVSLAASVPVRSHLLTVDVRFRLRVVGSPDAAATFWVAYGPLDDQWGVLQLRDAGHGLYDASAKLPSGRTMIVFLEGHGAIRTRAGRVPGGPTLTIRELGPWNFPGKAIPMIRWHVPIG